MAKITGSEVRLVLKTMVKAQDVALDYAVNGYIDDYALYVELIGLHDKLGEIIERNRKDALSRPKSKPMNNIKARLTVYQEFLAEEVDDMLCVVDQTALRAGDYTVKVFHRDLGESLVGVRIEGFKNDLVVKLEARVVEISYIGDNLCQRCGEEFTKKDVDGGRCLTCGSMIS